MVVEERGGRRGLGGDSYGGEKIGRECGGKG